MVEKREKSLGRLLILAARLHRVRIGERLQSLGLFPGQEQALEALAAGGPMPMGELAARLSVRPPTISKTIARLSAQGLVVRAADGGDGRLVKVELTEDGRARAAAIVGLLDEVDGEMLAAFGGKDRRRLRKLLRRSVKALGGTGKRGGKPGAAQPDDGLP
jgi:DNA-binding MarR family transcriptional regulator